MPGGRVFRVTVAVSNDCRPPAAACQSFEGNCPRTCPPPPARSPAPLPERSSASPRSACSPTRGSAWASAQRSLAPTAHTTAHALIARIVARRRCRGPLRVNLVPMVRSGRKLSTRGPIYKTCTEVVVGIIRPVLGIPCECPVRNPRSERPFEPRFEQPSRPNQQDWRSSAPRAAHPIRPSPAGRISADRNLLGFHAGRVAHY